MAKADSVSYFNEEQQRSMWTAEDHRKNRERLDALTKKLMGQAKEAGPLTLVEEEQLLRGLLEVVKAPAVPDLAWRLLAEVRGLRLLATVPMCEACAREVPHAGGDACTGCGYYTKARAYK